MFGGKLKIIVLIVITSLLLVGFTPSINSFFANNSYKYYKNNSNKEDSEYKKTNSEEDVNVYASFYWHPRYPDPGEEVTFYSSSHAYNGHIVSQRWEFEDGKWDYGHKTSMIFDQKGSYKITLRVSAVGTDGGYDRDYQTSYVEVGADPFPRFTFTPESPITGEEVKFDGSDSIDPDGEIISYKWSYYNIENSSDVKVIGTEEIIYYTWDKQGIYNILLDIVDDKGNNNTIEQTMYISILKINSVSKFSRKISFQIRNKGDIKAKNIKWNVKIDKYRLLGLFPKTYYQKSGEIESLPSENSREINLRNYRRAFSRIKLVVTATADNAIDVSKTYTGYIFGKFIYLTEKDIFNPFRMLMFAGIGFTIIFIILSILQFIL